MALRLGIFLATLAAAAACHAQIQLLPTSQIAGLAVHVNALRTPLTAGTPLTARYQWDFADPSPAYRYLEGWIAAHLYSVPGTYPLSLTVTDQSGHAHDFQKQIIIAPSHRRVFYVSADGDDTGDGSLDHPIASLEEVARRIGSDTEFRLRRGDRFPMRRIIRISGHDVVLTDYGSTKSNELPRLVWSGPRVEVHMLELERSSHDVTVRDLIFDSIFNHDTDRWKMPEAVWPAGVNAAVIGCTFLNVAYGVNCELAPTGVLVQDCTAPQVGADGTIIPFSNPDISSPGITGLRAYFVWAQGSDLVLLGNRVANSTREHCVRLGGIHRMLLAFNDLQNLDREGVDSQDMAKSTLAAQIGDHLYAFHNKFSAGQAGVGPLNRADLVNDPVRRADAFDWAVFDGNTFRCQFGLSPGASHVMLRNNIWLVDNAPAILLHGYDTNYSRGVKDVAILQNTAVNRGNAGSFLQMTGPAEHITVVNNLFFAPNLHVREDTADLVIQSPDLSGFDFIGGNVWPNPPAANISFRNNGGIIAALGRFVTPDDWKNLPQVHHDDFISLTPEQLKSPGALPTVPRRNEARWDIYGTERPPRTYPGAER